MLAALFPLPTEPLTHKLSWFPTYLKNVEIVELNQYQFFVCYPALFNIGWPAGTVPPKVSERDMVHSGPKEAEPSSPWQKVDVRAWEIETAVTYPKVGDDFRPRSGRKF